MGKSCLRMVVPFLVVVLSVGWPVRAQNGILTEVQILLVTKEEGTLEKAQAMLEKLLAKEPQNVSALCLLAEAHFHYGGFLKPGEGIKHWEQAQAYAERATELDPSCAHAHYLVAASLGRIGDAQGILKSLFLVNPMLYHLETTLVLDPNHAWAHFALSHMYDRLPARPLGRGDAAQALAFARTAWELEPTEPEFSLQYARLLIKQEQLDQAKEVLTTALTSPSIRWTIPLRDEAEQMLHRL